MFGQAGQQERTQLVLGGTPVGVAHDVGEEDPVARSPFVGHHHGGADEGVGGERGLDLAGLDPEAADLDLLVEPAEELEHPVRAHADLVAGAVEAAATARGIGHEPVRRQRRPAVVAACHARPAEQQLAALPRGDGRPVGVGDERVGVRDGHADRDRALGVGERHPAVGASERGAFGGAVAVAHLGAQLLDDPAGLHRRDDVAARDHVPDAGERAHPRVDDLPEQPGAQPQHGHAEPADGLLDRGGGGHPRRQDRQRRAVAEGAPQFEGRHVETQGREQQEHLVRVEVREVGPVHQPHHAAVGDLHALGAAGRAGGVHQVDQAVRGRPGRGRCVRPPAQIRLVDEHHGGRRRDPAGEPALGDRDGRARVGEHELQPLGWVGGVERDVETARLEDSQHRDEQVRTAFEAQCHRDLVADAQLTQPVREPVGPAVELAVVQPLVPEEHGGGLRGGGRVAGEQFVHADVRQRHGRATLRQHDHEGVLQHEYIRRLEHDGTPGAAAETNEQTRRQPGAPGTPRSRALRDVRTFRSWSALADHRSGRRPSSRCSWPR
ncbi:hypothetical protein QMK34_30050 [Amycolatopsis sp. H20-H5]|nr:hypothetical protein [Amycolatopsis sp. H20-H5]MEC3979510.1 hypothetical protein [Amycolatopsis sp. H20-H5]